MDPLPVGISVKGHEVSKVTPGSQAEKKGVRIGWCVMKINGKKMPKDGTKVEREMGWRAGHGVHPVD